MEARVTAFPRLMSAVVILCCPRDTLSHPTHLFSVENPVVTQERSQNHCLNRDRFFALIGVGVGRRWFFRTKTRCASSSIVVGSGRGCGDWVR